MKSSIDDMAKRPLSNRSKQLRYSILLAALLGGFGCNEKEAPVSGPSVLKTDEAAPDFELSGIDSKLYHLSDFKGQVVVLNFWATWCAPCVLEMPSLERLHQSLKDKGLRVIAINMDAPGADAEVKKFSSSYGHNQFLCYLRIFSS